jgi:hypothetical protein
MTEEEDRKGARDARVGEEGVDSLRFQEPPPHVNDIARRVIEAAVEVHRHLGPGYAESVHENALAIELGLRGILNVPVLMRGVKRIVLNRPMTYEEAVARAAALRGNQR